MCDTGIHSAQGATCGMPGDSPSAPPHQGDLTVVQLLGWCPRVACRLNMAGVSPCYFSALAKTQHTSAVTSLCSEVTFSMTHASCLCCMKMLAHHLATVELEEQVLSLGGAIGFI